MVETTDPKYAKATISLKDTITSTPKQRQTYKRDVNTYNTQVTNYYSEKQRVENENKRRQEEYQKQLAAYNKAKENSSIRVVYETVVTTTTKDPTPKVSTRADDKTPEVFKLSRGGFSYIESLGKNTSVVKKTTEPDETDKLYSKIFVGYTPSTKYSSISTPKPTAPTILSSPVKSDFIGLTPVLNQQNKERLAQEKTTYLGELKTEVKERYIKPYITPIVKGIKTIVNNPREAGRILKTESLPNLKAGFSSVANLQTNSYNSLVNRQKTLSNKDRLSNLKNVVTTPGNIQDITYQNVQEKPDFSPTTLAKASVIFGETVLVMEAPRIATGIKNLGLRAIGKEVPAETLYSEVARKSPSGIDATFNPKKTIDTFKKSQKNVKGTALEGLYPDEYMIGSSSTGNKFSTNRVLSKTELGQPMNETGGTFISPIKAGQPRFLRLAGEKTGSELSLNPFEIFTNKSNPTTYTVGLKEVRELPKRLISKEPSVFKDIETFQRSRVGKSEAYITRESSLGIKREPEAVLNVGQTFKEPILKKPLYTKLNGQTVRVRPIYLDESTNLIRQTSKIKNNLIDDLPINNNIKGIKTKRLTALDKKKMSGDYYYDIYTTKVSSPYNLGLTRSSKNPYNLDKISSYSSKNSYNLDKISSYPSISRSKEPYPSIPGSPVNEPIYEYSDGGGTRPEPDPTYEPRYSEGGGSEPSYSPVGYPSFSGGYPSLITSTTARPPTKYSRINTKDKSRESKEKDLSYRIEIKSKGKWVAVKDKTKRNYGSAFNKGASIVDSYAERSFRLKPYNKTPTSREPVSPISNKFYQPAKSPTLRSAFVEKTPYLIDTPGEVRGISYKGQQAKKNKKKNKKNMRGFNIW